MKRKIYFADLTHTGLGVNANIFPLGAALVAANACRELGNQFDFEIFKFSENLSQAMQNDLPAALCFSNYAWNSRLAYAWAKKVKQVHPQIVTIFGGPNFPVEPNRRKTYLSNRPAIDFYVKWDGELALVDLLMKLIDSRLNAEQLKAQGEISDNVCYVQGADYREGADQRVQNLDDIPSPYLTGLLDKFFELSFSPLLETTRGCPYSCTYCNDGHASRNRVIRKSPDLIRRELEYLARRAAKSSQLMLTDLNFGMYREDLETAEMLREIIERYQWPDRIETSTGKNRPDRLLESNRIINRDNAGIIKLGYSFQSTDDEVLEKVRRTNPSIQQLLPLRDYRQRRQNDHLEFFTEIILALPGDTRKKHYQSLREVIDVMGMNNIDIHQLAILTGSELDTEKQRGENQLDRKYRVFVGCAGIYDVLGSSLPVAEIEEVVVGHQQMSFADYLDCRVMTLLVKIYIDHDPFREIFGLVRNFGLSSFEVLYLIQEQTLGNYEPLVELIDSFLAGTQKPLFDDYAELVEFIADPNNLQKYLDGELGQNELLIHRLLAFRNCRDEINAALQEAVILYLQRENLLTEDVREYVEQAIRFGNLKRFDPENLISSVAGEFSFDFIAAGENGFEVDPVRIKADREQYRFYYNDDDLQFVKSLIERFGQASLQQNAKMFQKNNLLLMGRKVCRN